MKILKFSALATVALFAACGQNSSDATEDREQMRGEADALFAEQSALLKAYTDSALNAADSAALSRATENCEEALWRANKKYPQLTDAAMTQGQNDTLSLLTDIFIKAVTDGFGRINSPDSIAPEQKENPQAEKNR